MRYLALAVTSITLVAAQLRRGDYFDDKQPGPDAPRGVCLAQDGFCRPDWSKLLSELEQKPADMLAAIAPEEKTWIVDGTSLVIDETPTPIVVVMGAVRIGPLQSSSGTKSDKYSAKTLQGHFTLTNDFDFLLIPQNTTAETYKVVVVGKTSLEGTPNDILIEQVLSDAFLRDGAIIEIHRVTGAEGLTRMIVSSVGQNGKTSSVQLLPMPYFFQMPLIETASSSIDGEWVATLDSTETGPHGHKKSLTLTMSITQMSRDAYLLLIEGLNTHKAIIKRNSSTGAMSVESLYSSHLVADSHDLGRLEKDFISLISLADLCVVEKREMGVSGKSPALLSPTLIFRNKSHPNKEAAFIRAQFIDRNRNYKQIPISRWTWIPESILIYDPSAQPSKSLKTSLVPVVLELRRTDSSSMLDVYIGEGTHIRAMSMPSASPGRRPIRSVTTMADNVDDSSDIKHFMLSILAGFESIDVDPSGAFLSLVSAEASLSFNAAPVPSAGLWVLDRRYSSYHSSTIPDFVQERHVKLAVARDGDRLRATLHGNALVAEFIIDNVAPSKSRFDWRVKQLATRDLHVFHDRDDTNADGTIGDTDEFISLFFRDGLHVDAKRGLNIASLVFTNAVGDTLTFLHPLDLTVALLGQWKLISTDISSQESQATKLQETQPITLRLLPSGVGELVGELTGEEEFAVRLVEVPHNPALETTDAELDLNRVAKQNLIPRLWDVELTPVSKRNHFNHFETFGKHSIPLITGSDRHILQSILSQHVELNLHANKLSVKNEDVGSAEFVKILDERVQSLLQGRWTVEFVTAEVEAPDDANPSEAAPLGVAAAANTFLMRHVIEIRKATAGERKVSVVDVIGGRMIDSPQADGQEDVGTQQKKLPTSNGDSSFWQADSTTEYICTIKRAPDDLEIGRFSLTVNPFGLVRLTAMDRFATGSIRGPETELENLLFDFFRDVTFDSEGETTAPVMVEVLPTELIITNGESMLALSRAPTAHPVPSMLMVAAFSQEMSHETPNRQTEFIMENVPRSGGEAADVMPPTQHAIMMMRRVRRRLQSMDSLLQYIGIQSG